MTISTALGGKQARRQRLSFPMIGVSFISRWISCLLTLLNMTPLCCNTFLTSPKEIDIYMCKYVYCSSLDFSQITIVCDLSLYTLCFRFSYE